MSLARSLRFEIIFCPVIKRHNVSLHSDKLFDTGKQTAFVLYQCSRGYFVKLRHHFIIKGGKFRRSEGLTLETSAFESLYGG